MFPRDPQHFGQLRLVGRISLCLACVAVAGLVAVGVLAGLPSDEYGETVRAMTTTKRQLPWVMTVGGLLVVLATALTTWMITLYSSFRLAGSLYRLSLDLQIGIDTGRVPPIRVRRSDFAQAEAQQMEQTVGTLYEYYAQLDAAITEAAAALESQGTSSDEVKDALGKLDVLFERNKL